MTALLTSPAVLTEKPTTRREKDKGRKVTKTISVEHLAS